MTNNLGFSAAAQSTCAAQHHSMQVPIADFVDAACFLGSRDPLRQNQSKFLSRFQSRESIYHPVHRAMSYLSLFVYVTPVPLSSYRPVEPSTSRALICALVGGNSNEENTNCQEYQEQDSVS